MSKRSHADLIGIKKYIERSERSWEGGIQADIGALQLAMKDLLDVLIKERQCPEDLTKT